MDTLAIVLRVILSLAVVFGLLWLAHRVASRNQRTRGGTRDSLTVVARQGLAQKAAAVLIDSGDKRYLLGVSDGGVTLLDTLPRPEPAHESATRFEAALNTVRDSSATPQGGATGHERGGLWVPMSARTTTSEPANAQAAQTAEEISSIADDVAGQPRLLDHLRNGLARRGTWKDAALHVLRGRAA